MKRIVTITSLVIVFLLVLSPAFAWNKEAWRRTESMLYSGFWVYSYVAGNSNGQYFTSWTHNWDHGKGSDGPPPYFFCYYGKKFFHFPSQNPVYIETWSWGDVYDKFGEHCERFNAIASIQTSDP